jgi:beta-phosphoglucomutase-like phosphatase (HAD superfamily)
MAVRTATGPSGAASHTQESLDLDELAADWWEALAAEDSALRAGVRALGSQEVAARSHHLAEERVETARLLGGLGRLLGARSPLVTWLGGPAVTARMLGLPADAVACVFDLDGVLTTSDEVHAAAWTQVFDAFLVGHAERNHRPFIPFDPMRDYPELVAGRPRRDGIRTFLASRGISLPEGSPDDGLGAATVHGLANRKYRVLRRRLGGKGVAAFEGSHSYLEAARMARLRRAVVSASANTELILERAGLRSLVEACVDGHTIAAEELRVKPAPDTLLAACDLVRVEPSRAVAFETSPTGITAARAAGFGFVVGVARSGEADLLRASEADVVVTDLGELLTVGSDAGL